MKKLLALVLALVMTLGLATVSANAASLSDLKDNDKIVNREAAAIMQAIGVFEGDDQGNFNPGNNLKRSEAAKILATLMLGKTTAENLSATGGKFSDVAADAWYAKYVEYCAAEGIIAGVGNNQFDPDGPLTTAQYAKMLLCALGYNAENEKLVGEDWAINTTKLAQQVDLFAGNPAAIGSATVTRDEACLYAFNTLKTPMVTYAYNGSNLVPAGLSVGSTKADFERSAARDTQTISRALYNDGSARGTYLVEFAERHFPQLVRDSHDTDDWGNPATTWTLNRNKIGTYANKDMLVGTWTKVVEEQEVYKAIGGEYLTRLGNNLANENTYVALYIDGVEQNATTTNQLYNEIITNDDDDLRYSARGTEIYAYVDDDSYIDQGYSSRTTYLTIVVVHTFLAEATANATSSELRLTVYVNDNGEDAIEVQAKAKSEDVAEDFSAVKEEQRVLVQMTDPFDNDKRTVRHVLESKVTEDTYVSGYTTNKAATKMKSITIDGEQKYIADRAHTDPTILKTYTLEKLRNYTYDVYYDQYGYVIGIETNKDENNYVFMAGFEQGSSVLAATSVRANVIWTDGTMETITVKLSDNGTAKTYLNNIIKDNIANYNTVNDSHTDTGDATVNTWFTYTKNDNGQVVLNQAVGYWKNATDKSATGNTTQASVLVNNANSYKISSDNPTIRYTDAGQVAFGNDKSVFITVEADADDITGGAITEVNGVVTGIKNAKIETKSVNALGNFARNAQNVGYGANTGFQNKKDANANAYFIINSNGYITYAVIVSESKGGDAVFIIKQQRRDYVTGVGYVDTYYAIVNGTKGLIKVDCSETDTNDTKLQSGNLYLMRASGEYYVHRENTNANVTLNTDNNSKNGYAIATGLNGTTRKITIKGNTLWIVNNNVNAGYVLTDSKTVYFVTDDVTDEDEYDQYTTASSAKSAGEENGNVIYALYADCDGNSGVAKTVVFLSGKTGTGTTGTTGVGSTVYTNNLAYNSQFGGDMIYRYAATANTTQPSIADIRTRVQSLTGGTVRRVVAENTTFNANSYNTYIVTMSDDTTYYVDCVKVFTIKVDDTIQATIQQGNGTLSLSSASIALGSKAANHKYVLASTTGTANAPSATNTVAGLLSTSDYITADANGTLTIGNVVAKNYELRTAYVLTVSGALSGTGTVTATYKTPANTTTPLPTVTISTTTVGLNVVLPVGTTFALTAQPDQTEFVTIENVKSGASQKTLINQVQAKKTGTAIGSFTLNEDMSLAAKEEFLVKFEGVEQAYQAAGIGVTIGTGTTFTSTYDGKTYLKNGLNKDGTSVFNASGKYAPTDAASLTLTTAATTNGNVNVTYTVTAGDAVDGVIDIYRVADVNAGTLTVKYADGKFVGTTDQVKFGTQLSGITTSNAANKAQVTVNGGTPADLSGTTYTVNDWAVAFSEIKK